MLTSRRCYDYTNVNQLGLLYKFKFSYRHCFATQSQNSDAVSPSVLKVYGFSQRNFPNKMFARLSLNK